MGLIFSKILMISLIFAIGLLFELYSVEGNGRCNVPIDKLVFDNGEANLVKFYSADACSGP